MRLINQHCSHISKGFFRLHLNLEYLSTERVLKKSLGPQRLKRVYQAMRRPVMLSKTSRRALDLYEGQFLNIFSLHKGSHIEC
jgi:hypothetical protein